MFFFRGLRNNHAARLSSCDSRTKISKKAIATTHRQLPKNMTPELVALIEEKLELDWRPEQIAGRLKLEEHFISYESIYRDIRKDNKDDGTLYEKISLKTCLG